MNSSTDTDVKTASDRAGSGRLQKTGGSFKELSEKIAKLPNVAQLAILLIVAGLSLTVVFNIIGFAGSLFSGGAQQSGPAFNLPETPDAESTPAATPGDKPATPDQRQQLWDTVGIQYRNLETRIEDVDSLSRQVMAQNLRQSANTKCAALGASQCRSDFQYLMREFLVKYQQFQVYTTALETPPIQPGSDVAPNAVPVDKMILNSDTIQNYRRVREELLDLAAALSQVGGDTPQFTLTTDLQKSLQNFATALQNYETLRQQQSAATYSATPGADFAPNTPTTTEPPATPSAAPASTP